MVCSQDMGARYQEEARKVHEKDNARLEKISMIAM